MKIHALAVEVYRNYELGDCTNRGISSYFNTLLLAVPDGNIIFDSDQIIPLNFCMIERKYYNDKEYARIVPATINECGKIVKRPGWWMFGGNIARTSDFRFYEQTLYALDIHDRRE